MSRYKGRLDDLANLWARSEDEDDANVELDLQLAWHYQRSAEHLDRRCHFARICQYEVNHQNYPLEDK